MRPFSIALRWALCLSLTPLFGQGRDDLRLPQLSASEAARALDDIRNSRLTSDVCFGFEAVHRPRRGDASAPVKGTLWASSRGDAHLLRIEMQDSANTRILARKSPSGSEVLVHADGRLTRPTAGSFTPLSAGLLVSAFDLQLPFTHWNGTKYMSTERGRRPMHVFSARQEGFAGEVTFGVDRAYGAILEAKVRSSDGRPLRSLAVEDFAKAGDQWVLGTCSVRDEASRNTDLLKFTEAALGLRFGDDVFTEASLSRPTEKPEGFRPL